MRAAVLLRGLHQMLRDERPRQGGHQRILLHVHAVGLDGRQAVFVDKFVFRVDDDGLHGAAVESSLAHGLHILAALPEIQGHGDDVTAGLLGQVWDGDRRI